MLYFAYASNLSKEFMFSRCPNATPIKKAVLKDYKIVFNELADIVQNEGEKVYGVLFAISKQELSQLDVMEGYPDLYDRIIVELEGEDGHTYEAFVYTMVDKRLEAPPEHYYNILEKGYKDWNLPLDELEKAREMK